MNSTKTFLRILACCAGVLILSENLDNRWQFVTLAGKSGALYFGVFYVVYLLSLRFGRKIAWDQILRIEFLAALPLVFWPIVSLAFPAQAVAWSSLLFFCLIILSFIFRLMQLQRIGKFHRLHNSTMIIMVFWMFVTGEAYIENSSLGPYCLLNNVGKEFEMDRTLFWVPFDFAKDLLHKDDDNGSEISKPETEIYFFGGSATRGDGLTDYSKAFPYLVEKNLAKVFPDRNIRVTNAAVGGYTTYQIAKMIEEYGEKINADLFVLYISFNDGGKITGRYTYKQMDEIKRGVYQGAGGTMIGPIQRLLGRFRTYNLLVQTANSYKRSLQGTPFDITVNAVSVPEMLENLEIVFLYCRQKNTRLVLAAEALNMSILGHLETSAYKAYHEALENFAQSHDTPFINIHQVISQKPDSNRLFFDLVHLNENGHDQVAKIFTQLIREQKLID